MQSPAEDDADKGLVGRNIVLARRLDGDISQPVLAKRLGIDRRQLSEWERGIWEPSPRNLRKIALATGRSMEFFYERHDEASPC